MNLLNNRYRVLRELGAGGFGNTYLAEDTQMPSQRCCVIKQLKPVTYNPEVYQLIQERFAREAAVLEKLGAKSDRIPKLYAYFTENGQFYLVQEWIEGTTLTKQVQQFGLLTESTVREILASLLSVLDYVHTQGIVHRDIKPDNIIIRSSDAKPVLIDFGAVRETVATQLNSQGHTMSSIVIGTPGFMPAEQAAGRPVYGSDLYSLALTAIYLLTGKMPQQLESDPTTGETIWNRQGVSSSLADVLDKAVRSHPRDRFSTAKAMLEALQTDTAPLPETIGFSPLETKTPFSSSSVPTATFQTTSPKPATNSNAIILGSLIASGLIGGAVVIGMLMRQSNAPISVTAVNSTPSAVTSPTPTPAVTSSPTSVASSSPTPQSTDCKQLLSSHIGQYEGRSAIVNSQNRTSGKIAIEISSQTDSSCAVIARVEEFSPLGGKGILNGKFDPSLGKQVDLVGRLSHQSKPKVWDVEMKLRFTNESTIEGQSTWKPKSGIEDKKIYYEEFTATKSIASNSPSSPSVTANPSNTLPFFMVRRVREEDLQGKSKFELDVMRNEIFARYGRRFNRNDLQAYFDRQDWYTPQYAADEFPESLVTPLQMQNARFIEKYQQKNEP
jgi:serine/threonine protein kinase